MVTSTTLRSNLKSVDADMADQANPGHGIPSQDPDNAAQTPLEAHEIEREANSVMVGGGVMAGAVAGVAIGAVTAGPMGILVGASLGAVVGALGGVAVGVSANSVEVPIDEPATAPYVHLHIEDSGGNGSAVVLIHGWPLSAKAWEPQVTVLEAAGYRVVTYDRRGFGYSGKLETDYDFDTLADDLYRVMDQCGLEKVTLVGFSMGGGEVARYVTRHGESRLRSVVFAAAVPPYLMKTADNPDGPLTPEKAQDKRNSLEHDRNAYFDEFTTGFFSANGVLQVTESQRAEAMAICLQSSQQAALTCMDSFSTTDFREDLKRLTVPTLIIHGDADAVVPIEGSGLRTHIAVPHSQLVTVAGAPHGLNVSHAKAFNEALLLFLQANS